VKTAVGILALALTLGPFLYFGFKRGAARSRGSVGMFGGLMEMVAWPQGHGILVLRHGELRFSSSDGVGGTRAIYPCFGDEAVTGLSLSLCQLDCNDIKLTTMDGLDIQIALTIWWRITDVCAYYNFVADRTTRTTEVTHHRALSMIGAKARATSIAILSGAGIKDITRYRTTIASGNRHLMAQVLHPTIALPGLPAIQS